MRDPVKKLETVLRTFYGWYRETQPMVEKVQRDRATVAPLDGLLRQTADVALAQLADALAGAFRDRGRAAQRRRALIGLALDFATWRRLDREGLDDEGAAALMANAVAAAGRG